ncbi:MAG TPA: ankyrin repeat domain-containing protein [Vicinamibacterales bacterium]|nr:ankyrin repeat domain-containing protein [Vicinamibacterales bacterium]
MSKAIVGACGLTLGVACLLLLLGSARPAEAADDLGLVNAARTQDGSRVRALLNRKADVNVRSDDGSTALLWAAHWNDAATADMLIRAGANANVSNDFGMTPLSRACTNGSAALVELLLEAGANPNTPIGTGETPIMTCASSGSADAVRRLIARGADVNAKEPSQNQDALMWAAAERHPDVVHLLVEAGANPQAHTKKGFTALHFAAREGDFESVRQLLAAGVNVNIRSRPDEPAVAAKEGVVGGRSASGTTGAVAARGPGYQATISAGSTPLLVATVRGYVPLAIFLLEHGADPNVLDAGFTALHWAAGTWEGGISNPVYGFTDAMSGIQNRQQKLALVKALLAHGANPNSRMTRRPPGFSGLGGGYEDAAGATPFLLASAAVDLEMMRLLLAAGADPAQMTDTKATPVMAASGLNRGIGESLVNEAQALEAARFLFQLGADAKGTTTSGENALFGAAYRGWNTLLALLIDRGADVNAVSKAGVTPWLAASGYGDRLGGVLYNKAGADLLLKHGADPQLGKPCQAQNKCR